jgi:hypothetical protein
MEKKKFNPQLLIGRNVFKYAPRADWYEITEIKEIEPNNIKMTLTHDTFSIEESYTMQNLSDLSKGKMVKNLKLIEQTMANGGNINGFNYSIGGL